MDSGIKGTFTTKEAIAAAVSHAKKVYDYLINCDEGPVLSQDMNPFGSYCEDMDDILNVMAKSELSSILNADLAYQDTIGRKTSLMGVLFPRSCR
ncbi:hypothetical protein Z949_1865 [Sulfitobacter guttiformis KCTC 32187]|nr:hypothetical protein Z949_1865 [Sulfitobacter guttiformis KCTC 32187]